MPLECAFLLSGPYDIASLTEATKNKSALCRTRLRAHTTERIVQLVSEMLKDLGFTEAYVEFLLSDLTRKAVGELTFTNSNSQEISASQISLVQLLMIRLYTSTEQSKTCGRDLAQMLKQGLRGRKTEDVMKLKDVIKTLDNALKSLPPYMSEKALFRGEEIKIECLQVGMQFDMVSFTSFSRVAYEALPFTQAQNGSLFVLQNPKSGVDIAFASDMPREMEILYPRNTRFEVLHVFSGAEARDHVPELKSETVGDQLTVIVIAEV